MAAMTEEQKDAHIHKLSTIVARLLTDERGTFAAGWRDGYDCRKKGIELTGSEVQDGWEKFVAAMEVV